MITHPHTRSDYPQPTSPRIPRPATLARATACSPEIEQRIRRLLTWNAGDCGLISDKAKDLIASFYFAHHISLHDVRMIAKPAIYAAMVVWIADIVDATKQSNGV